MIYKFTTLLGGLMFAAMSSLCIDTPPEMNGNDISPKYYTETNTPVTVFPNFTITDADGDDIKGLVIAFTSGYSENEDILSFTTQNGISGTFDKVNGALILSGSASPSNYQTAVQSITYTNDAAPGSASYAQREFTISFANSDYSPSTGHFYEFINSTLYWDAAKTAASAKTYYGLQGYLATVTSAEENSFVKSKISSYNTWLAGSDAASEGSWLWVTGPEAGNQFSSISVAYNGSYVNWKSGEPNNTGDAENCLLMNSSDGSWNDGGNNTSLGYTVEYGGMAGDPTINMTTTTTLNVVAPQPPVINGNNDSPTYNTSEYNPVIVFPNFTVTDAEESNIKGLTIHFSSGYQSNQDTLLFTNTSKITGSFDDTQGALVLLGDASPLEYQNAMRSITYVNNAPLFGLIDGSQREFTISLANDDYFSQDGSLDNGHFYENVNTSVTWTEAKAAASAKTYYGLQGYLATVTSANENIFIQNKISDMIWLGGSDRETEGIWKWVTGPESGNQFSTGANAYNGSYVNWNSGEPNSNGADEDYTMMYAATNPGEWNDIYPTKTYGYVVEYGGMTGDPALTMTTTTTLNIDVVRPKSPGGIVDNLELWLKADAGFTYTSTTNAEWLDQSLNDIVLNANLVTGGDNNISAPIFGANVVNFNPGIIFDGVDAGLSTVADAADFGFSEWTIFSVQQMPPITTGSQTPWIYSSGGANTMAIFVQPNSDGVDIGVNNTSLGYVTSPLLDNNVPHIFGYAANVSSSQVYIDAQVTNKSGQSAMPGSGAFMVGLDCDIAETQDGDNQFKGGIGEILMFSQKLSDTDRQKVQSYLALKYGITLNQTSATNYLSSAGSVVWDGTANASYKTDIFGIGRDDASGLNQKVSRSVNSGNSPVLATNADFTSSNSDAGRTTSLDDGNFMLMGHNNGTENSFTSSFDGGTNNRSDRVWKVDETGTVGNVYFAIPKTAIMFPSGIPVLVISNDLTFDSSDNVVNLTDDGTYYWASINPNDEAYLAFATTTPGFTVSETTLTIDENAGTGTFTVVLDVQPSNDVVFDVASDKTEEATVDKATLTFTSANWDTPQTVTVTGVDDDIDRDDTATITVMVKDASSDDSFDALTDQTAGITLTDDDTAGFTVSKIALTIDENAGTGSFTVVLNSEPTSDVVFDVTSDKTDEATIDKSTLTFTSANWDTSQTVTVTGVDDDIDRDDTATITVAVKDASSDDTFDALTDQTVGITLTDDDVAPTVSTSAVSSITSSSVTMGGDMSDKGSADVTETGVVYSSINASPEIGGADVTQDSNGAATGIFSETIGSLAPNTTYNFQAYAINSAGTSYGGVQSFTTKQTQTITFNSLSDKAYGNSDFDPSATASSGLTVSYSSSNTSVATIVAGKIHIVGVGSCTIYADQAGDDTYDVAAQVSQGLNITQKEITVTADAGQTKVYGQADPTFTYTTSATLESGDSFSGVLSRATGEDVGSYAITIGTLSAGSNYDLTFVSKDFSITQKAITVTVDAGQTKVYGGADPTFTYTTSATLESGDSFTGALSRATGEDVGSYAITIGTLSAGSNYDLTFVSKDFSITQKAITVTVDAGQTKVYGGADPTFTYTTSATLESGDSFSGVLSRATGEDVRSYAITIGTLSAGSNYDLTFVSKDFSITQKAITVTVDAGQTKVYGGADPTFTYTTSATLESGDSFTGALSRATGEDVGSYAITIGTLSAGSNYDLTFVSKDFSITQKAITVTVDAGQTKVYGGADPTFTYTTSATLESGDSFSGVLSRATGEDVGSYAITIGTLSAGSNYDLTFVSKAFSITQKAITVTADAGQTKVYGDADPTFTYTTSATLESGDSFTGALSRATGEDVGSYAITIGTLSAGSNYDLTFVSKAFSITQKAITVTVDAGQTKVYGGADPTFTYTASSALESGDSFSGFLSRSIGEAVGSYAILQGTLSAGSNYDLTFVSKDFSITQKAITVTVDAGQTKVYGGADPTFTYTTSATLESGDSFSGVLSRTSGESVGSYAILQGTLSAGSNYDLTFVSKDFSITQKAITVTVDAGQTKVYGGADPTFTYTTSSALESGDSFSGVLSRTSGESVGSYAITIGTLSAGSNYDLTFVSKDFAVTQKQITITADAGQTKVYGDADPTFTYTTSATLESGDSFSGVLSRTSGEDAGSYAITIGTLSAGSNYDLTFVSKAFSITQKAITVTVDAGQTKVYGDADPTFTYTTSATLESGDSFSGVLSRTSGEDVGSYAITIGTLSAGSNYDLTFVSKAFSITQKAITVTVDAGQTKVYGDADPTFTYTTSATLESGDSFTGVLSRTSGESVGSYAILQGTLSAGSNYDLTFVSKDFAVTQKQITITADAGQTKVYGDADPTFTYTTSATLESGDSFSGVLSRTSGEDAGSYAITIGTLSAGSNYDLTFVSKDFAVTQKQITVTADAGQTKVYGDADPTFTYTTSATLESGDSFSGVLSRTSGEDVGSYAITIGTLSAGSNYDLTFVSKDFSITQKSLTVTAENKTKEYDGAVFTGFTVTYSGFITGEDETDLSGTLVYSGSATTATNVGTGYVITPGGLTSSNYVITFADGSLDITLKVLTITAEDKSKEYDGAVYSGFTVTYAGFRIGEDETDLSGTLAFTGTASTAINVGTGYVITPGGLTSSNYHIIFADGSLDITQKAITVTADAGQTKVYGDADPAFTYTASAALESGDSFSGVLSRATGEDVGSYAITIGTLSAGSNYDLTFVSKDFSITQKAITVTADAGQTKVYGGADPTFTYTTSSALESGDSFSGVLSRTSGESVGSYAILQGTLSAGSNYDLTFVSKAFSITQKAITVTAGAGQTKVYGDANPAFTYTTSATLESGDSFTGALSRATGESVGSYAILQGTLSAGSNYDLTFVSKDFAVTQKQITVTADAGQTKVYGDADPTFTYTASSALESGDSFSGVLSRATGEDVGSYAITIGTLSAGSNYDLTFVSKDFSITQKAITVTADAGQTKVYGDADPTFTYTTSATLESGDSFTGVLSRTSGESVGSYAILQGTLSAGSNYDLTFVSKAFSITQKSLTITAEDKSKEYDGAVFTGFTVTYVGFISGEDETDLSGTLAFTGTASTAINVGTGYVITPGGLISSNYVITFADGSLDITIASQTIIFNPLGTKVYGDAPFTISATGGISGNPVVFISSDQNVAVCSGVNGEIVNIIGVGTCMINANQAGNSNFNPAIQVSQILTVNKYIAGDTDGDGVITDPEIAGDTDGDGVITDPEIAGDTDGDGVITDPEIAGDTDGDGVITDPEIAGDTDGDGVITDPEIAGDTDGDGVITDPEIAGDTDGNGIIDDSELAGDTDGDGIITDPEIAGDTDGDGVITDPEIAGDTDGDGVITDPEIAGDTDGDGVITDPEIAGDTDGDGVITDPEIAGDTDGNGTIDDSELAGDTDGDGIITDPEIAGDTDGDGVITDPEIAGDIDGDGVISDPEIAGDTDGDGVITDPEIAGDTDGDGVITDPEIAGDTDGDGIITDPEIAGDTDGDGVITDPEIAGDTDGDGVITDPEIAGDTDGDGVITDPEIAGDTDGDGVITDPEIAGDTDGDGVITDPEIAGDTDGDGVITDPEIAGDTNGDGVIDDSESTEITLDLVNDVDNPLSLCDDTEVELAYTGLIGNPSQYKITFEESASTAGFHDIDYTDILSDSRVFRFSVPVGVPDGLYEGNLQLRNNFGVESVMYKFQFIVNVSAEYIISKYDDVVLCDNSSERFAAYQWYKDGVAIPGAVNQFYNDPDGLVGSYSLDLITIDGQHLTTCSKEFNIPLNKSISVYPNPISSNGKCTVRMNGFEEDELLGSQLSIFNSFGAKVFYTEDVIKENVLLLQLKNGVYVGNVTTETGSKYSFKILIQK